MIMKKCSQCNEVKDEEKFCKHAQHRDGLSSACKNCRSIHRKKPEIRAKEREAKNRDYHSNPEKYKKYMKKFRDSPTGMISRFNSLLKVNYGITAEQYNEMFSNQNGCCAICAIHQSKLKRRLSVDHNHDTGKVRELLCNHCNSALGIMRESTELFNKAINYLQKHKEKS